MTTVHQSASPALHFSKSKKKGRRWRDDDHICGNDAPEAARLELEHDMLKLACRRNFFAPIQPNTALSILDIATGTGIWCLEVLDQLPRARLTTLDVDTVLFKHFLHGPRARRYFGVLDRLSFEKADATMPLPFADGSFDFSHARLPDTFLSEEHWPLLIREMTRVTKPDGWVELLTGGHFSTTQPSQVIAAVLDAEIQMCSHINVAPTGGPGLSRYLEEAGIAQFRRRTHLIGMNEKERKLVARDMKALVQGTKDLILKYNILPEAQFDGYMDQFEREALNTGFHMPFHRIWFQPKDQCRDVTI